jgi:hypothetical protein
MSITWAMSNLLLGAERISQGTGTTPTGWMEPSLLKKSIKKNDEKKKKTKR